MQCRWCRLCVLVRMTNASSNLTDIPDVSTMGYMTGLIVSSSLIDSKWWAAFTFFYAASSPKNASRHKNCYDSSTPQYKPNSYPYDHSPRPVSCRPTASRYPQVSGEIRQVTDWHHYSSQVDSKRRVMSAPPGRSASRNKKRGEIIPPPSFRWKIYN